MTRLRIGATIGTLFGLMTILSGARALFGGADMGNVIGFVLWFNFLAGFAYVAAGIGLWLRAPWAAGLALLIALATAAVYAAFGVHVLTGGAYEQRTTVAMAIRTALWTWLAWEARRIRA